MTAERIARDLVGSLDWLCRKLAIDEREVLEQRISAALVAERDDATRKWFALLQNPTDHVIDAARAACASWQDLPPGVAGEREKYRRRLRAVARAISDQLDPTKEKI